MCDAIIFGCSNSSHLAKTVSDKTGIEYFEVKKTIFPDNEYLIEVKEEVQGKDVYVFQSFQSKEHDPNNLIFEYILAVSTLKEFSPNKIVGVIPYFAYARQSARFRGGQAQSPLILADIFKHVGIDDVWSFDIHDYPLDSTSIFGISGINFTALDLFAEYYKELDNIVVIGPDKGARERAECLAQKLDMQYDFFEKERVRYDDVKMFGKKIDLKGKKVLIVDDMISTGKTIMNSIQIAKQNGCGEIYVAVTHPVLVNNALDLIYSAGAKEIIATNTIESKISKLSIESILVKHLMDLYSKEIKIIKS